MYAGVRQRSVEFGFQEIFNAVYHEIYNRLGGIDNTVGICDFNREALKETLVDSIKEMLFFGEIFKTSRASRLSFRV